MKSNGIGCWVDFRYVMAMRINASKETDPAENMVVKLYWQCHPPCTGDSMDTLKRYHKEAIKYNINSFSSDYKIWGKYYRNLFILE